MKKQVTPKRPKTKNAVELYARMWPREIFDHISDTGLTSTKPLAKSLDFLNSPGVYILYRDDVPYHVGKATKLRQRLSWHATHPHVRYYNFRNCFSVFVIPDSDDRGHIEGILIAGMPTANSAEPQLPKKKFPKELTAMVRKIT